MTPRQRWKLFLLLCCSKTLQNTAASRTWSCNILWNAVTFLTWLRIENGKCQQKVMDVKSSLYARFPNSTVPQNLFIKKSAFSISGGISTWHLETGLAMSISADVLLIFEVLKFPRTENLKGKSVSRGILLKSREVEHANAIQEGNLVTLENRMILKV